MTIEESIELLEQNGYLSEHFKTGSQMAYWLDDLKARFEQCRVEAILSQEPGRFIMETFGRFENGLDLLFISFRFSYDPAEDELQLNSIHARLRKFQKTFHLSKPADLVLADALHQTLSKASALNDHKDLYQELKGQFRHERNPENDYDPDAPFRKQHPDRLSSDFEKPDESIGPLKGGLSPELKRRFRL